LTTAAACASCGGCRAASAAGVAVRAGMLLVDPRTNCGRARDLGARVVQALVDGFGEDNGGIHDAARLGRALTDGIDAAQSMIVCYGLTATGDALSDAGIHFHRHI
jgi:hypothetical protein